MSDIIIRQESFYSVIDKIKPLNLLHHQETDDLKEEVPLDPDYELYKFLEEQGMLIVITARELGKLVGYLTYTTTPVLHHKSTKIANADMFYILPSYRGSMLGLRMLRNAEAVLKDKGVQMINMNLKVKLDFGVLLQRVGYLHTELVYSKYLGE
jgi:ribosomal protein S18 acetylase RimI-like enzyme